MLVYKAATLAIAALRLCRFLGISVCSLTGWIKPSSGLSGIYFYALCKRILQTVCHSYKRKKKTQTTKTPQNKSWNYLFVGNLRSFPWFHRYEKRDLSKSIIYHLHWQIYRLPSGYMRDGCEFFFYSRWDNSEVTGRSSGDPSKYLLCDPAMCLIFPYPLVYYFQF